MEDIDTPTFIASIQKASDLDQSFKFYVINHVNKLYTKCHVLEKENAMYEKLDDSKEERLELAKQLVENQQRKILEYQTDDGDAPMDQTPTPIVPAGPTIVQEGINGIVKSFSVNQRRGIIEFKLNESDDVKEAVVFENISKSDIDKPDYRTLRPKEKFFFDLCDNGHGKSSARNVLGPDGANVHGYYVKVKVISNFRPNANNQNLFKCIMLNAQVLQPTRKENILDLIFSTDPHSVMDIEIKDPIGDHNVIHFQTSDEFAADIEPLTYVDFKNGDYNALNCYFNCVNWEIIKDFIKII